MRISFLSENKTNNPGICAEHGLSIYIETDEMNILFDAGASDMFAENAQKMGIDLRNADFCVISHGHYDHTEGVPYFASLNKDAKIILHCEAYIDTYEIDANGRIDPVTTGIRWNEQVRKDLESRIIFTDRELWLSENIAVSGTIDDIEGSPMTEYFYEKRGDEYIKDPMNHEQFLAVRTEKGVFVFSGCSHRGVRPVLAHVKRLFPGEKIAGLAAGMHLYNADSRTRTEIVNEVAELDMEMVMPVHCTGIDAICELKTALGEKCIVASAGDIYEY